ncbi:MAG: transposase, partial [Candidatus Kuenenia stuttgartiensis]|nr:transposase [Candidatus Kuenenia stuttgartiensis]
MKFILGKDRNQISFFCLEEQIEQNNEIRFIELFVNSINLAEAGFKLDFIENGRPAYHPADLLKLFLYGYLNRIRSSRQMEKECKRNLELMWLMHGLVPDHNTIANFRKDNPQAIKNVFRSTVKLAKHFQLIGGKLLAGDGTKLRAQNSKKNNFNEKKIERHIVYIDAKLEEYSNALAEHDGDISTSSIPGEQKEKITSKIDQHQLHRKKYERLMEQLEESGEVQISTSDPDSRQMIVRNNITEVAYNVQTTVDAKHNILINYEVTNENDSKAMGSMLEQAIVEHPFGIIKRQWDFYYIMAKQGISRASADVGLIFTTFNLRRIFNIIDQNRLKRFLKKLAFYFLVLRTLFSAFYAS